jgi:ABC-2 type transport system ATP-binding protein
VIELFGVGKVYGATTAVRDLTVTVRPGVVTGFLGPNGAGKSTTMRLIVGLDRPSQGEIRVNGRSFARSPAPLCEIGAVLDAKSMQPARTARQHMKVMALTHRIPDARVDELLALTGLAPAAKSPIKAFSLGMLQRLAIAVALLGDPNVLIFDEPVNGLDAEGVMWVRALLRQQASLGKTVLVSSHLMSEMQHTAQHLIVLGRGRLLADVPMDEFIARASGVAARFTSPDADAIVAAFAGEGVTAIPLAPQTVELRGVAARQIAERAATEGWVVYQLAPVEASLEDAYLRLTAGAVQYSSGRAPWPATQPAPAQPWPAPPAGYPPPQGGPQP